VITFMNEAGRHHAYNNANNQDYIVFKKNRNFAVMALADGVSTCEKAQDGAREACEAISEHLLKHASRFMNMTEREISQCLLSNILSRIEKKAKADGIDITEYSSTIACILLDRRLNKVLLFSIGDSLILATKHDCCNVMAMPSDSRNGCYVTTTHGVAKLAQVGIMDARDIQSIVICSDGAWNLMYHRNHLETEVRECLIDKKYTKLKDLLMQKERFDDCSFISMDLNELRWRNAA